VHHDPDHIDEGRDREDGAAAADMPITRPISSPKTTAPITVFRRLS
jgi:hypothetical protein